VKAKASPDTHGPATPDHSEKETFWAVVKGFYVHGIYLLLAQQEMIANIYRRLLPLATIRNARPYELRRKGDCMQGKTGLLCLFICMSLLITGCENKSGKSSTPEITKYQDAQIDGNTSVSNEVRADSPQVGVAGTGRATRILAVWNDHRLGDRNVFFNYRLSTGTWVHANDLQVDTGLSKGMFANELDMAYSADGQIIHIVWSDQREGQETIWYNVSHDGGASFAAKAVPLSHRWPFNAKNTEPHVVCSSNGQIVYVAWRYGISDVVIRYAEDAGQTWSSFAPDNTPDNFFAQAPRAFSGDFQGRGTWVARDISLDCGDDGRYCHIAWQGGWDYILYRCWDRQTVAWLPAAREVVASNGANYVRRVQLKCNGAGTTAYLVYKDTTFNRITFNSTNDFGTSFSGEVGVSLTLPFFANLYCDRASGDVCVVWENFDPTASPAATWQVMARHRSNAGVWDSVATLSRLGYKNNRPFLLPEITGNASQVYAVWADFSDFTKPYIYYNHSNDWGKTWDSNTGIAVSTPGANFIDRIYLPSIAVNSDSIVYAAWGEKRNRATPQVFGVDPLAPVRSDAVISHHQPTRLHAWAPRIFANGQNVYGIWLSDRFGGQDVFFSRSQDYGTNWVDDFIVNQSPGELCQNHQLFGDTSNFVYIGWEKQEPAETQNNSGGHALGEPIGRIVFQRFQFTGRPDIPPAQPVFSFISASERAVSPARKYMRQTAHDEGKPVSCDARSVIVSQELTSIESRFFGDNSGVLYFVANVKEDTLSDAGNNPNAYNALLRASKDRGNTWDLGRFWGYSDYKESFLRIAGQADGDKLYAVYEVRVGSHSDIHFIRWYNYGQSLDYFSVLDDDAGSQYTSLQPKMCKNETRLLVVWTEFRDGVNPDIYYNYSPDNGSDGSWYGAQPLASLASDSLAYGRVRLASCDQAFYAVWSQYDATSDRFGVQFAAVDVDASGDIQVRPAIRLDSGIASAQHPELASEGDKVYVMWEDSRFGASDIVARFSSNRGTTWSEEVLLNTNAPGTSYAVEPIGAISGNFAYVMWSDYRDGKNIRFEGRER
jgi:hypothetical protein